MAYDFLGLVNDVNRRVNEVELTYSNFDSANGFYNAAKDSVNAAIRAVDYQQFEWPFNHSTQSDTTVAGTTRYDFPYDNKTVDMESFRVRRSEALNTETVRLQHIQYEEYLDKYVDQEYNSTNANSGTPRYVFRTPDNRYGLVPLPDKAYTVDYEYYRINSDMILPTDVPSIPEQFRYVIVEGAMYHVFLFRGNTQDATLAQQRFNDGLKQMRTVYINRYDYVRTSQIIRSARTGGYTKVE